MKAFQDLDLQDLHWVQAGWSSTYELRDGDETVVATIKKTSWWKNSFEVDAPGNRWHFERKGFVNRRIEITSIGTGDLVSTFDYQGWGNEGILRLPDGRSYVWKRVSFWDEKWAWLESDDVNVKDADPVLAFDTGGTFRARAELTFDEDADFPSLLVFLGWILHTYLTQDRATAATAAITAT